MNKADRHNAQETTRASKIINRSMTRRLRGFFEDCETEQWCLFVSEDGKDWTGWLWLTPDSDKAIAIAVHLANDFPFTPPQVQIDGDVQHYCIDDEGYLNDLWKNSWSPACQRMPTIMWTVIGTLNEGQYNSDKRPHS